MQIIERCLGTRSILLKGHRGNSAILFNPKPMETYTINLSWLCLPILMGIVILAAFFGTRARLQYAKRISDAQARGAFNDLNTPKQKIRFRWRGLLALIGAVGAMSSLVTVILQSFGVISIPIVIILAAFSIFGALSSVAGFLMKREIDRRL